MAEKKTDFPEEYVDEANSSGFSIGKKYRILMGNNTLDILAGSETWTETLAKELARLGHEVTAYSPQLGFIATKLEAAGIKCINTVQPDGQMKPWSPILEEPGGQYDFIICNHYEITRTLRQAYPTTPIIATVHGILHKDPQSGQIWPEHPVTDLKVDQYISVSEEIQELLKSVYGIDSTIIRNFVDLERFKKVGELPEKPRGILVNSNYWGTDDEIMEPIRKVAEHYGAKLAAVGANFVPTYEVETVLQDFDIVFGMGRSIIEPMAMGKLAICHGRWGTGGVITRENVEYIRQTNFSGRNSTNGLMGFEEMLELIKEAYTQENIDQLHTYMQENHNVEVAAKEYLKIAEHLIKSL